MKYICPVCGYYGLDNPPRDEYGAPSFDMCNCCGVEFGYEDCSSESICKFREKWIKSGCPWMIKEDKPINWSLEQQLKNIEIEE